MEDKITLKEGFDLAVENPIRTGVRTLDAHEPCHVESREMNVLTYYTDDRNNGKQFINYQRQRGNAGRA
jgi:hypothetical protein